MFNTLLVHYGEIALKGKNRPFFEKKLIKNIKLALGKNFKRIERIQTRIVVELKKEVDLKSIEESLKKVFGIAWFAFCYVCKSSLDDIKKSLERNFDFSNINKIKIVVNRADKSFPLNSSEITRELGNYLSKKFNLKVNLTNPDKEIFVEVLRKRAFIFDKKFQGLYGLPVDVSGKVLHMLSGGIDSPVAAWLLMKRGCKLDFIHFHGYRKFDENLNSKIIDLVKILNYYNFNSKIFFIPFHSFEVKSLEIPEEYRLVIFRRFMVKVAEKIAGLNKINFISTGESIAQVSSQTLENLYVIDNATSIPILRPLLTYDKHEIIEIAKKIKTYEISLKPYKDCCSLFMAPHPATRTNLEKIIEIEKEIDLDKAVQEAVKETETIELAYS